MERHNRILDFDRQWPGPEELRPRVYRTQEEKDIWNSIAVENEYKLGPLVESDVVIDIGAHIGAFSHLARRMGSKHIYAFEIDPWHVEAALQNLKDGMQGSDPDIVLINAAVVRGDQYRSLEYHYNGAWNSFGAVGPTVNSISLDQILEKHDKVRFLKIDCEGGEWPILYTCTQLHKVEEIAGEYHLDSRLGDLHAPELENLPYPRTLETLMKFLYGNGFSVKVEEHGDIGNFWAKRRDWRPGLTEYTQKRVLTLDWYKEDGTYERGVWESPKAAMIVGNDGQVDYLLVNLKGLRDQVGSD